MLVLQVSECSCNAFSYVMYNYTAYICISVAGTTRGRDRMMLTVLLQMNLLRRTDVDGSVMMNLLRRTDVDGSLNMNFC